jgi:hypothetical protein
MGRKETRNVMHQDTILMGRKETRNVGPTVIVAVSKIKA